MIVRLKAAYEERERTDVSKSNGRRWILALLVKCIFGNDIFCRVGLVPTWPIFAEFFSNVSLRSMETSLRSLRIRTWTPAFPTNCSVLPASLAALDHS